MRKRAGSHSLAHGSGGVLAMVVGGSHLVSLSVKREINIFNPLRVIEGTIGVFF